MNIVVYVLLFTLLCLTIAVPQQPEINDQYETKAVPVKAEHPEDNTVLPELETVSISNPQLDTREIAVESFTTRIYKSCSLPIIKFFSSHKVSSVLRNIGVCVVNGVMELVTYYLPAPLIPLIASAAGMVIPFEPVVLLKERMPVTSYRRAFRTAMDSFMGTFDKFKIDDADPYMTQRFNRRINYDSQEKDKKNIQVILNKKKNNS